MPALNDIVASALIVLSCQVALGQVAPLPKPADLPQSALPDPLVC